MSETAELADLSEVSTATLERLRSGLVEHHVSTPVTRAGLLAFGIKHQLEALEAALSGHSVLACISIVEVALAERRRSARPDPELVWTGPERTKATARDTAVVLRSLFESAREQVILAGFSFAKGNVVLEPLYRAMRDRGVDVRMFVHVQQVEDLRDVDGHVREQLRKFMSDAWPFGAPTPHLYYDARTRVPGPPWSSLHAKCVIVDEARAFVSSANFSVRAQEHNIEAGVLLDDPVFSRHLARQWLGLIDAGLVIEAQSS